MTAVGVVVLRETANLNFYSMTVLLVIPGGAIAVGAIASIGFCYGSVRFERRPDFSLALLILSIAPITVFLIYFYDYQTITTEDGRKASEFLSFYEFMEVRLKTARYVIGRGRAPTGEIGEIGYWLALIQFVGFMVAALVTPFIYLNSK